MLMVLALVAFAERRDGWAGALLGLGAAAKFFPALLLLPLFLQRLQDREPDRSVRLLWWTAGSWAVVNLPFAIVAPGAWWEFFRFNGERPPDFDSLWYIALPPLERDLHSTATRQRPVARAVLRTRRPAVPVGAAPASPAFPRWTLGFPLARDASC